MLELEYLLIKKRFTFREYLHSLRQLFPKGVAWNWPLVYEDILQPYGVITKEQFGYPSIYAAPRILPLGIVSAEAFGVMIATMMIAPAGIASAQAFGTLNINRNVLPTGISSSETFGTAAITEGFYLYDDFENGSIKSGWNSAFASVPANWTVRDQSGQKIAYSPNHSVSALFPQSTTKISGNFEVKWQFVIGTNSGGNTSLHIQIKDPTDGHLHGNLYYVPSELHLVDNITDRGIQTGITAPKIVTCKMVRSSGVIWTYYNDDATGGEAGSWIRNDAWSTPGSSISFSSDCVLEIDGDDGYGGYGFIEVKGDLLV